MTVYETIVIMEGPYCELIFILSYYDDNMNDQKKEIGRRIKYSP